MNSLACCEILKQVEKFSRQEYISFSSYLTLSKNLESSIKKGSYCRPLNLLTTRIF